MPKLGIILVGWENTFLYNPTTFSSRSFPFLLCYNTKILPFVLIFLSANATSNFVNVLVIITYWNYNNAFLLLLPAILTSAVLMALINQCVQIWVFQVIQTVLPKSLGDFPPKLVGGDGKSIVRFDVNTSVDDFPDSNETFAEEEVDITILSHEVNKHLLKIIPKAIGISSHKKCAVRGIPEAVSTENCRLLCL